MDSEMRQLGGAANYSTPKLTLSKQIPYSKACKEQMQMQTPPLLPSVSIPFRWEEVPGKPRVMSSGGATPPSTKSKTAACRCLELPPRLQLHEEANAMMIMHSSPTTVLDDGPFVGRSLSLACTFSFRKGTVGSGKTTMVSNLGSGRWGSFREERRRRKDSMDFSQSLRDIFRSEDINDHNVNVNVKKKKISRSVKRKRSFFTFSTINSSKYLLGDIYASFKQAVPWRRSS